MALAKKKLLQRIPVIDEVGKRRTIIKYAQSGSTEEPKSESISVVEEYRLSTGHMVEPIGPDLFRTTDGRHLYKAC